MLALTLLPALVLLAAGSWAVARSLGVAGAVGAWEDVAATGREVIRLAEPGAGPELHDVLAAHRDELSASLTQARRWVFVGDRFLAVLPWLVVGVAVALIAAAAAASRRLARQLARPIEELVVVAGRMGRGEPLPAEPQSSLREVRTLDQALRHAATRLAEARERAVAAERTRVWGEMARRVAHEMKNPLTPLRLAAHRLARASPASPGPGGAAELAEVIAQEVRRLEELAAQFSELGRPPAGPATEVDIPALLATLLESDVPPGIAVELDAAPGIPPAVGRYDALLRAFRNLIRNAVEAMAGSADPRLTLSIRPASGVRGAAGWIEIRIRDTGVGLPVGGADRIFEPDFTTKTSGTGLGLPLVRQAIAADGGTVQALGREAGAEFIIRLPSPAAATPEPHRSQHETSAR
jgi:two-component system, NtrC family, nitrogen regulation sensor histidine kinase NtrY